MSPVEPIKPDAQGPDIIPRNIHFSFDQTLPANWHSGEPAISRFYDALSLTFPEGERFFIESVRHFAPAIADPGLQARIKTFTAQESVHSREHTSYNKHMLHHGMPVDRFERLIKRMMRFAQRWTPWKTQLALTCAYEHYTALFAEKILGDPAVMAGAHPLYRDLWCWHALEEAEHKSVAFDVYQAVAPGLAGYLRRVFVMAFATFDFFIAIFLLEAWLLWHRGDLWKVKSLGRAFTHLWISPGIWRHVLFGVFSYMRPSFHPSERDTGGLLERWRSRYADFRSGIPQT